MHMQQAFGDRLSPEFEAEKGTLPQTLQKNPTPGIKQ